MSSLTSIQRGAFGGLQSVRTIYLDYNNLTEIPRQTYNKQQNNNNNNKNNNNIKKIII